MKQRIVLASDYYIFPALIVVREEDDGVKRITPIPLQRAILFRLIWSWLAFTLRSWTGQVVAKVIRRIQSEARAVVDDLQAVERWFIGGLYKAGLGVVMGAGRSRSLCWGFLGR
jgi:hypothetical protein